MFQDMVKNKKTTLGGVAFVFYALFLLFGDLSGGEGLAGVDFADLIAPISAALAGFGLISAKDA